MTLWEWLRMHIWQWAVGDEEDRPPPEMVELQQAQLAQELERLGVTVDLDKLEREVRRRALNAQRDVIGGRAA